MNSEQSLLEDKDVSLLIDSLIEDERSNGQTYPRSLAYRHLYDTLHKTKRPRQIMNETQDAYSYLAKGDRYSLEENTKANTIREYLQNLIYKKRRDITPSCDTRELEEYIDKLRTNYKKILDNEAKQPSYSRSITPIFDDMKYMVELLKDSSEIGLYEHSEFPTLREEITKSYLPNILRKSKKSLFIFRDKDIFNKFKNIVLKSLKSKTVCNTR